MYSPEAMSKDVSSNLMFSSGGGNTSFKNGFLDGDFFKSSKEMLGSSSDLFTDHIQQQQQQNGSGLMRYRSAPSSFFASYLDGGSKNTTTSDSSESDSMFTALLNCNEPGDGIPHQPAQVNPYYHQHQQQQQQQPQLKLEVNEIGPNQSSFQQNVNEFSCVNSATAPVSVGYQDAVRAGGGSVVGSYPVSIGMENQGRVGMQSSTTSSNLVRQSSYPAGFFSGYDVMKEVGNFRNSNGINGEASPSTGGLNNHINFGSGSSSSSRFMPTIAENGNEMLATHSPDHVSGYQNKTWNDSFNSSKRNRDGDLKMFSGFSGLDNQDLAPRNHTALTHHLSLPKTAAEMSALDKYLQFQQDSVPCKIRAKRGCATHPRSIAERMRRTRISDRIKKLQELFPNMDKQTNTADMLDLAVEYIKDLQNQVQTLTETRARCTCSSNQQQQCSSHEHHV